MNFWYNGQQSVKEERVSIKFATFQKSFEYLTMSFYRVTHEAIGEDGCNDIGFYDGLQIVLRAQIAIKAGEEVCISYINPLDGKLDASLTSTMID